MKAHVGTHFFRQLGALLRIAIPGLVSPESGFMVLVAVSLGARTLCDIWMIRNATSIEK